MRRIIITTLFTVFLAMGWQRASGFAFLGPFFGPDALWQTAAFGFFPNTEFGTIGVPGDATWLGDVGGPKNIGEEYRRNSGGIFYSYDSTFQGYFGYQGETNADQAFAIMNNFFGANSNGVDGYSANLSEFPFRSLFYNGTAQGYYLTDIKSVILHLLVEQMGLASPERFTWVIHDRIVESPPGCPLGSFYIVVQRNFGDVDQPLNGPQTGTIYSPYVDNLLYSYGIADKCSLPGIPWQAITIPFAVNTRGPAYLAVAAGIYEGLLAVTDFTGRGLGGLQSGAYYAGLTEDDAAGMRFLMSSNNIQYEIPTTGSELELTNYNLQPLITSPLGPLLQFAQTNPPTGLLAQFPGLVIDSVMTNFTFASNAIVGSYFTNFPGEQVGTLPTFFIFTNGWHFFYQTNYVYTFGNLVIFNYTSNTPAQLVTTSLAYQNGAQYPSPPVTNTSTVNIILTNQPSGQYYLIPTNSCGFQFVITNGLNLPDGTYTNETIATATNNNPNFPGEAGFVGTESIIENLTNSFLQYYGCTFTTSGPAFYQGIQQTKFIRVSDGNVDPVTDLYRQPVTNFYSMNMVSNGMLFRQTFRRIAVQPDIDLQAVDQAEANLFNGIVSRNINFETGEVPVNGAGAALLSGPGIIDQPVIFQFNKVGTAWWNGPFADTNAYITGYQSTVNQATGIPNLMWASFDGSTNPPTVYPTGASIQELQSQMLITISPGTLPTGYTNAFYQVQFSATGGTQNPAGGGSTGGYMWSGTNFPTGLVFNGGVLQGYPQTNGTFDVTIQLTDFSNPPKVVSMPYILTILP